MITLFYIVVNTVGALETARAAVNESMEILSALIDTAARNKYLRLSIYYHQRTFLFRHVPRAVVLIIKVW